ncbi:hypothetical protein L0244_40115 [bacterium]|nr:hypothetical protein [bacterium]
MKISKISYRKGFQERKNQSRIYDQEITAHADLQEGEDPTEAMRKLCRWVEEQIVYLKALEQIAK